MITLFRLFFRQELKYGYSNLNYFLAELFAMVFGLTTYWLTAKALSPHFSSQLAWGHMDYFSFVVTGEALLMVPLQALAGGGRVAKIMLVDRMLEPLLLVPNAVKKVILNYSLVLALQDFIYAIVLLTSADLIFGLGFSYSLGLMSLLFGLIFLPGFLGIGFLISSIILYFGRGQSVTNQVAALLSLLAGTYFPLDVFPESLRRILIDFSPFTFLLQEMRGYISTGEINSHWLVYALVFGFFSGALGWVGLSISVTAVRSRGVQNFTYQ